VRIEPGRYTTILEPQAVSDFVGQLFRDDLVRAGLDRKCTQGDCMDEHGSSRNALTGKPRDPGQNQVGLTQIGQLVVDPRLSIWSDPTDPNLGFPPLAAKLVGGDPRDVQVFQAAQWIKDGVLTQLPYDRGYGIRELGHDTGSPMQGAFRMSGGETSVEEMVSTTKRGLLVTRFYDVTVINDMSTLFRGYTRDGFWLIENGKISKAIKNMAFTESILFALNNVEQLGVPQRTFNPVMGGRMLVSPTPSFVPALKIRDFSFTALTDAV
jgi:predicted Zn-dependent protease